MRKSDRIAEFVQGLDPGATCGLDPHLAGYFQCFNEGRYYEAHDVLEDLWLRQGKAHPDHAFHKGLIQLAGGFVHLRLQYLNPDHPKHGRRLAPAGRLLLLAAENLRPYPRRHRWVDVAGAIHLAEETALVIGEMDPRKNPWSPSMMPRLTPSFPPDQERR
jgi:predicted metal-dependent hydrolase